MIEMDLIHRGDFALTMFKHLIEVNGINTKNMIVAYVPKETFLRISNSEGEGKKYKVELKITEVNNYDNTNKSS